MSNETLSRRASPGGGGSSRPSPPSPTVCKDDAVEADVEAGVEAGVEGEGLAAEPGATEDVKLTVQVAK